MKAGDYTTIHTPSGDREDALIVDVTGTDQYGDEEPVISVWHPHFNGELDFYQETDDQGRHYNVGNGAVWMK